MRGLLKIHELNIGVWSAGKRELLNFQEPGARGGLVSSNDMESETAEWSE